MINVYCKDKGWLFQDLQALFRKAGALASEDPLPYATSWICLRTDEWNRCPDLSRLVLQVHDLWQHDLPRSVGALVRSHEDQREIPAGHGFCRPLGAISIMRPLERSRGGDIFTVGWVGRPARWHGQEVKSPQPLINALRILRHEQKIEEVRVILMGSGLLQYAEECSKIAGVTCDLYQRSEHPIETYPALYAQMDLSVITSTIDAGPLPLFESLACGVPVLSTRVGWAEKMLNGKNGWTYRSNLATSLELAHRTMATNNRYFETREEISTGMPWRLDGPDGWIEQNMELARLLS